MPELLHTVQSYGEHQAVSPGLIEGTVVTLLVHVRDLHVHDPLITRLAESYSHGEGFLRFFEERCQRQGIFIFDEPESALSPSRQIEFLKLMRRMEEIGHCQIIMATHSPMLMAYPNARLLRLTKYGLEPVTVKDTDHYKVMREFCEDPKGFVDAAIAE